MAAADQSSRLSNVKIFGKFKVVCVEQGQTGRTHSGKTWLKKCVDSIQMGKGRRFITCAKRANHMTNRSSLSIPTLPLQTDLTSSPSVYRSALKLVRRLYTPTPVRRVAGLACQLAVLDAYRGVIRSVET